MTNSAPHRTRFLDSASLNLRLITLCLVASVASGCSPGDSPGEVAPPHESAPSAEPTPALSRDPAPAVPAVPALSDLASGPAEAPLQAPELRDLDLLVLMPGGEPATVVPVRFLDTALVPRASLLRATGGEPDAEKLLEVLGEQKMTDSSGRVTFSTSGGPLLASASLGQLFVMQPFAPPAPNAEVLTLQLALDASVRARAIGPDGRSRPGIPIALTMELPTPGAGSASRWIDLAIRETSGDDATVRFRDPRGGVQASTGKLAPRFGLRAAIPGLDDPTPTLFDPDAPPERPIEIVVPPLSTLVVEVLTSSGQLMDLDADVVVDEPNATAGSRLRARLSSGRATLTTVVPGTLLRVTVQPLDGTRAFEGVGPGALRAGDVATISVSMDRPTAGKNR